MKIQGKVCASCQEFKAYKFYYRDSAKADGYRTKCKACEREVQKMAHDKAFKGMYPFAKECKCCHRVLGPQSFAKDPTKTDGLHPYCMECQKHDRQLHGPIARRIERPRSRHNIRVGY